MARNPKNDIAINDIAIENYEPQHMIQVERLN
jgi:hypothetical protein